MTHITHAASVRDGIEIAFGGGANPVAAGTTHTFTFAWLRDHCACAECRHPDTQQRLLDTFALPKDLAVTALELGAGGKTLRLSWPDGHESHFAAADLAESLLPVGLLTSEIKSWNEAEIAADFPQVTYDVLILDYAVL